MRDLEFTTFCGLGIGLCLAALPWHWRARNSGTLLYLGWTLVGCLIYFVNSIVWAGNINNPAPIWCDISTKLLIGLSVGVTASSLCINRQLYHIATIKDVTKIRSSKSRDLVINLILGIGLPVMVMALHYVVQGHRYDILEDIGCWPTIYNTLPALPMVLIWPILISIASFIYAGLAIRAFVQSHHQFSQVLSNSETGLNMSRYFRLMALSTTEMCCSLPLALYFTISDLTGPTLNPWISWEDTHQDFGHINIYPHAVLEALPSLRMQLNLTRWVVPGGAFVFFLYFGFSGEARREYMRIIWKLLAHIGVKRNDNPLNSTWSRAPILGNHRPRGVAITFTETESDFDTTHSTKNNLDQFNGHYMPPEETKTQTQDLEGQR